MHLSSADPLHWSWQAFKQFAKEYEPDFTVDLGDLASWGVISSYNRGVFRKLEGRRIAQEYKLMNRELDEIQKFSPSHTLLQGNHDVWIDEYIDLHPELEGMLEYETNLRLHERGIKFVPLPQQPWQCGKLSMLHGWWCGANAAKKHLTMLGGSLVHGHVHKFATACQKNFADGSYWQATSIGCLCDTRPTYQRARVTDHVNGFALLYMQPKTLDFSLVPVYMDRERGFIVEGVKYGIRG